MVPVWGFRVSGLGLGFQGFGFGLGCLGLLDLETSNGWCMVYGNQNRCLNPEP